MPISPRSSSTMRAMAVRLIITATSKNTIGNALPSDWMDSRSDFSELNPPICDRSCTYQRTCGMLSSSSFCLDCSVRSVSFFCWSNFDCAWSSCALASANCGLAAITVSRSVSRVVSSRDPAAAPACILTIWSICWLSWLRLLSICCCAAANCLSVCAFASSICLVPASSSS